MRKNGFTLIELLAVIVILAIIALIATPIVLSIIDNTKQSSMLRSAEMYLKGVETSVATAIIHEKNVTDGKHPITPTGDVCLGTLQGTGKTATCNGETIEVQMNGEKPTSGTVKIASGKITDIELIYSNGKTIVKNAGKLVYGEKEEPVVAKTLDTICTHDTTNGVSARTAGAKYSCEVKEGTSYNFYVLTTPAEGDTTINLIMDRNICEDGTPTDASKEEKCLVAYNSSGGAAGVGPVTAMTYLNNATSSWENIDNLDLTYDDEGTNFTGFVLNGKARLPYKSEVSSYDSTNKTNAYLYDYLNQSGTIQTNAISGIYGYWTFSCYAGISTDAWTVDFDGTVGFSDVGVDFGSYFGVRAVINLKI